ncbi:MAG: DUF4013 domain-containing protein [Nanoarchaeota archaeon]|nr:DUF4013 domain-containing protein [Nanoarchaeota archaeon]
MNFIEAVKRPFQDVKTLIIGMIVMLIPIVNFTIGVGYFLDCARTSLKKKNTLPEFKDWGNLFMKGVGAFVISLVYAIPVFIVLLLTIGSTLLTGGVSALLNNGGLALLNAIATFSLGMVVTLVVALIIAILSSAAMIRYAEKGNLGAAFEFVAVAKKAFSGTYLAAWVVSMVYTLLVVFVLSLIPFVGAMVAVFITGVTMYTLLAEAYKEA